MAQVRMSGIRKSYDKNSMVIQGVDLTVRDGEFMVFVGPSGCGKSTLLRCIAGLEDISGGELSIGGRVVNDVPPAERGIAMVFQSYALYPHMNLYDNMAFGLELARLPKAEIDAAVQQAAKILHIEHLLQRKPKDLSGGQRQRVAIGRAIVRQPEVFLFDEPLSNLDAALRVKMRYEFARLHQQLKTTMVYVTHDQVEAMTLADRIVVLKGGRIEQVGTPMEIYSRPATAFVAAFVGSPAINLLPVVLSAGANGSTRATLPTGETIDTPIAFDRLAPGEGWRVGVRAENVGVANDGRLSAAVDVLERLGDRTLAYCKLGDGTAIIAEDADMSSLKVGDAVRIAIDPAGVHLFDGEALGHHGAA